MQRAPCGPSSPLRALRQRETGSGRRNSPAASPRRFPHPETLVQHRHSGLQHDGCVNAAAWSESGHLLLTGSDDRTVKVWQTWKLEETGAGEEVPHETLHSGHVGNVFGVAFVPGTGERTVVSCAAEGMIRLIDVAEGRGHGEGSQLLHPRIQYIAASGGHSMVMMMLVLLLVLLLLPVLVLTLSLSLRCISSPS